MALIRQGQRVNLSCLLARTPKIVTYELGPLKFRPGLTLGPVWLRDDERVVGYGRCEPEILAIPRGVYVVADATERFYIGKFEQTFGKRWVYSSENRLYHSTRNFIRDELDAKKVLTVYVESEAALKKQIGLDSEWVDVNSIEARLIRLFGAKWNRNGLRDIPEDAQLVTVAPVPETPLDNTGT